MEDFLRPPPPACGSVLMSITAVTVMPLVARFSSGMASNLRQPRFAGTLSFSLKNAWMSAAFRLFRVDCMNDWRPEMVQ